MQVLAGLLLLLLLPPPSESSADAAGLQELIIRVSQKNQKSEFCYATNPSGFHRLDEPPKKNSAL